MAIDNKYEGNFSSEGAKNAKTGVPGMADKILGITTLPSSDNKTPEEFEQDIHVLHEHILDRDRKLLQFKDGIDYPGKHQEALDAYLQEIGLEYTTDTRYIAFERLILLKEGALRNYLEKTNMDDAEKRKLITRATEVAADYHAGLFSSLLREIESSDLLTPFYRAILQGFHDVGCVVNKLHKRFVEYIVDDLNPSLLNRFGGNAEAIEYMRSHKLLDVRADGSDAGFCYSTIIQCGDRYEVASYAKVFPKEIAELSLCIEQCIHVIERLEDGVYNEKEAYISYLQALKSAFCEMDNSRILERWAEADATWMKITGPIQPVHPMEYYDDSIRKSVSMESDVRIRDTKIYTSTVPTGIRSLFDEIIEEKGVSKDAQVYLFTYKSLDQVQSHFCAPFSYYGARLTVMPMAQVIPNEPMVSFEHGKKIFAFMRQYLEQNRDKPSMRIEAEMLAPEFRKRIREMLHDKDERYYRVFDASTVGHEFGHVLWMTRDTESSMNSTGNFKNIEEWKATAGGHLSFFLNSESTLENIKDILAEHAHRTVVKCIPRMKLESLQPYYCETLIHLKIFFDSGLMYLDETGKVALNFAPEIIQKFIKMYSEEYKKLVELYIEKGDASLFLNRFAEWVDGRFLPTDPDIRAFVLRYYEAYSSFGTQTEGSAS